jgi:WS/DGAT/MGAT family acyltransferase
MREKRLNSEPFSSVDAAWLRIDVPTNMAIITGVMIFDEPLDLERFKKTVEYRLLCYERFRQRAREKNGFRGSLRWEPDANFNLDAHLPHATLPPPGGLPGLQALAGQLMSTPLDRDKPLWQIHIVDDLEGGSALVVRLHHCIADGLALVQVLLSLADESPDAPWPEPPAEPDTTESTLFGRFILPPLRLTNQALNISGKILQGSLDLLDDPWYIKSIARSGIDNAAALAKLLLISPDRKTLFRGECGVEKRVTWSEPINLDVVKAIGKSSNGTVNDVLLAAMSGALRSYLEYRGEIVDFLDIRAVVPVSIRPPEELGKLGNRFGLIFLPLPIGLKDPVARLAILKQRMDSIKDSREAAVAFGILTAAGFGPRQVENIIVNIFGKKGTAVMTNVPGPRKLLYLAGKPLRRIMFWVPQPGGLSLGISILSYNGEVMVGVASDAGLIPDPEEIVRGFNAEIQVLQARVSAEIDQPATGELSPAD